MQVFYFEGKGECDFIAQTAEQTCQAIQVCWELNAANLNREYNSLIEACKELGLVEGLILTLDKDDQVISEGINIKIMPVWKWLLNVA